MSNVPSVWISVYRRGMRAVPSQETLAPLQTRRSGGGQLWPILPCVGWCGASPQHPRRGGGTPSPPPRTYTHSATGPSHTVPSSGTWFSFSIRPPAPPRMFGFVKTLNSLHTKSPNQTKEIEGGYRDWKWKEWRESRDVDMFHQHFNRILPQDAWPRAGRLIQRPTEEMGREQERLLNYPLQS